MTDQRLNAASPLDEEARLTALRQFAILDTPPERAYDDVAELASFICEAPIALISLVDSDRQWFKSRLGLAAGETPRSQSFCANTLATGQTLIVEDARTDPRFRDNPLVLGDPHIRFYAGAPIIEPGGHVFGTVCVIDSKPRALSAKQISALEALARQVMTLLTQRRTLSERKLQATRLAEAEETLTQSQERLAFAVDAAGLGAWFYDPGRGVVGGDDRMAEIFGLGTNEGPAEVWFAAIDSADRDRVAREFASGVAGEPYDTEYRVVQDGSVRWVRAKARLSGAPGSQRMVGICEDVTRRKLTEEALQSTAERLRLAQAAGRIATWEWNLITGEILWGEGAAWIYGRPPHELDHVDKLFSYIEKEDLSALREALEPALHGRGEFRTEVRICWPDGSRHWVVARAQAVLSPEGKPISMVGINMDVTERRLAADALMQSEKLAAVGRLASSIAHEINNPLEAVTNLLYLAKTGEDLAEIRTYLNIADIELRRTSAIANQTLRFHKQATSPVAVTCEDLIGSVLNIQQSRISNAHIYVEKRMRSGTAVLCFEGEIRQVLSNLIANAIDAMHGTGGRLLIRSRNGQDWTTGRRGLVITVADTGTGMAQSTLSKLFDAFFTTKGIGGTGLGLWISREILERHHGRLAVRSSQRPRSHGSVFSLFLPFDAAVR